METRPQQQQHTQSVQRSPSILCLLDFIFGNMIIHYAKTRILHPRQGLEDILEVINEEKLLDVNIKLIYLLAGRADAHMSPSAYVRVLEKVLIGLARINPRLMVVVGGIVVGPEDSPDTRLNVADINARVARLAEREHHWLFFNPNNCLMLGGLPERKMFDNKGQLVKGGCRLVAQALVAASKSARMLQNFAILPPLTGLL